MLSDGSVVTNEQLNWHQKHFPPGTTSFTVPKDNIESEPDDLHELAEGITIHLC